ncbi:uncharacterized protein LOC130047587 [Ostrea edulis]|uniref:uncharacterized protein LOC130047587 n=1 Tax=Ostrea edulis TaxID=37623 RepID=UPI0024AF260B|nr:uncharacterized protein LOC130047587 [Ostrea edulis]
MAISLRYWASYTEGRAKLQRRSENSVNSNHVLRFFYDEENRVITGTVQASMRNLAYKVMIQESLHWILSPEAPIQQPPVPLLEDLLLSEDFLHVNDQDTWLRQQLKVTSHIIETTVEKTKGQRTNALWAAVRKLRITASNFGQVLRAVRLKRISKSLMKRLLSAYNLEKCAAIAWGITNEKMAIEKYTVLGASVHETGLWLHESGVIGASPDGIVNHQPCCPPDILHFQSEAAKYLKPDLIEVKCPYSARDMKIADAVEVVKEFFLEKVADQLHLKENTDYYHQVQGQLHIANKMCCDLVVWTQEDLAIIRIARDDNWAINIEKLINFYFHKFMPEVNKT